MSSRDGALSEIEVELPMVAAVRLLDVLHEAGVHLCEVHTTRHESWASQRIIVQEADGRPLGCERWLYLQNEILPLLQVATREDASASA